MARDEDDRYARIGGQGEGELREVIDKAEITKEALQTTVEAMWRYKIPLAAVNDLKRRKELRKLMEKRRN